MIVKLHCVETPQHCTPEGTPAVDSYAYRLRLSGAGTWSDVTQYAAGVAAVSIPLLARTLSATLAASMPWSAWGAHVVLLLEATLINGAFNDTIRLIAQRPRPYIVDNPAIPGEPFHYTSFYSGHTSFAALSGTLLFLFFWSVQASAGWMALAGLLATSLTLMTAAFRVLSGFHWATDTLFGAFAGVAVALIVRAAHTRSDPKDGA